MFSVSVHHILQILATRNEAEEMLLFSFIVLVPATTLGLTGADYHFLKEWYA